MSTTTDRSTGFTLIEMMLVIAIIALSATIVVPLASSATTTFGVNRDATATLELIRYAQRSARMATYGSDTGVRIEAHRLIAFAGDSFDTRLAEHDMNIEIGSDIEAMLPAEITFASPDGGASGLLEIPITRGSETRVVTIEESGIAYLSP